MGRKAWLRLDSALVLEYSRRCHGALSDILTDMLVPGGRLTNASWRALQGRVLGYSYDEKQGRVLQIPAHLRDERLLAKPFTEQGCVVGVLRHNVRVVKVLDRARYNAALAGQRLLMVVAADRADGGAASLRLPHFMYYKFAAVPSLTRTVPARRVDPLSRAGGRA